VDALGNPYSADTGNNTIRKVASDGTISTLPVFVLWPTGVLADAVGNVYVTPDHDRVLKITPNGNVVGVAGVLDGGLSLRDGISDGGPATSALLAVPWTVALDLAGNLYIADSHFQRVRKVDRGGTITTFAGANPILFSAIDGYYVPGGFGGDNGPATRLAKFSIGRGGGSSRKHLHRRCGQQSDPEDLGGRSIAIHNSSHQRRQFRSWPCTGRHRQHLRHQPEQCLWNRHGRQNATSDGTKRNSSRGFGIRRFRRDDLRRTHVCRRQRQRPRADQHSDSVQRSGVGVLYVSSRRMRCKRRGHQQWSLEQSGRREHAAGTTGHFHGQRQRRSHSSRNDRPACHRKYARGKERSRVDLRYGSGPG